MSQLSEALFTTTQQRVLGLLYNRPDRSFYTNEILRATGMGVATIKRELDRMTAAGLLSLRRQGNQLHYQANPDCPIYNELRGIIRKTIGMVDVLREALAPAAENIVWGFVFGSVASGKDSAGSDIDLMLIGDLSFAEAVTALHPAQEALSREVNPKVFRVEEWQRLLRENDSFIRELSRKPRLDVMGNWNESGKPDRNQPGNY